MSESVDDTTEGTVSVVGAAFGVSCSGGLESWTVDGTSCRELESNGGLAVAAVVGVAIGLETNDGGDVVTGDAGLVVGKIAGPSVSVSRSASIGTIR